MIDNSSSVVTDKRSSKISLYVRKKAGTSGAVAEIKIPARPAKPDPIQIKNVTKGSYYIKVAGPAVAGCEYGISESVDGELLWKPGTQFSICLMV